MPFSFDHLVHVTEKPEIAVKQFQQYGFNALEGGQHLHWGTYNGLCHFDLSYIEFIGINSLDTAKTVNDNTLITQLVDEIHKGEGFSRLALRTNDINEAARYFISQGLNVLGPVPGERTRKDGSKIKWAMLFISDDSNDSYRYPFIIDWKMTDDQRRADLRHHAILSEHPSSEVKFESVAFAVHNLEKSSQQWETLFNLNGMPPYFDSTLNSYCRLLNLSGTPIILCEPAGNGMVAETLATKGERPIVANLSTTEASQQLSFYGGLYNIYHKK